MAYTYFGNGVDFNEGTIEKFLGEAGQAYAGYLMTKMGEYHSMGGTTGGSSNEYSVFAEKYMVFRDRIMQDTAPDYEAYTTEWLDAWVADGIMTEEEKQQSLDDLNGLAGTSEYPATQNQWLVLLIDGYLTSMVDRYAAMPSDGTTGPDEYTESPIIKRDVDPNEKAVLMTKIQEYFGTLQTRIATMMQLDGGASSTAATAGASRDLMKLAMQNSQYELFGLGLSYTSMQVMSMVY